MTRKDLARIRRRYTPEKNDLSIIRGCFVHENREIVSTFSKSPLSLPTSFGPAWAPAWEIRNGFLR